MPKYERYGIWNRTMKFKEFLKIPPIIIKAMPTHGGHSKDKKPIIIKAMPTHGGHSKKIEEKASDLISEPWMHKNDNDHIAPNTLGVINHMQEQHDITKHKHVAAINKYTSHSRNINGHLIKGKEPKPIHHKLDKVLNDHEIHHDLHVYHGTNEFNPGHEASKHPQRKIQLPGYTSTTLHKKTAEQFSGTGHDKRNGKSHIIHIHLKKGQKGAYIGHNTKWDDNEYEHLLPRNTVLKIKKKPTILKDNTHVWHATVSK